MAVAVFSNTLLTSKFKGCLIGALVGDCLGNPFEFDMYVPLERLNNFFTDLMSGASTKILPYTDDSSMTLSVASSLVEKRELNAKDMAKKFVAEYYRQPHRGYGLNVQNVFKALKANKCEDVFLPAKLQFKGSGSYGNGAAMRIAPIGLFGNSRGEQYIMNAAEECARITHTHQNGYNGAILQCLAVNAALRLDSSQAFDPINFIDNLLEKMENVEKETKDPRKPYCESLKKIKEIYIQNRENMSSEGIAECLGNGDDESALRSVPTAIYSFLRGMKPIKGYKSLNPFLRTLVFAISIGGDTDTIASMAGAIAGAYYGAELIPDVLQQRCESIDKFIKLADNLFDAAQKKE